MWHRIDACGKHLSPSQANPILDGKIWTLNENDDNDE